MSKQNTMGRWCLLLIAVVVLIAPAFVIAADPNVAGGKTEQWTDTECKTVGGDYDAGGKACYGKPAVANLGVSIGGLKQATLSQYVAAVYKYMVAAAAVLAVIFIMIGGFRWITAAGGEQVGAARKMIVNAVVGMILAFSSYILLQTVNPATLSLTPPRIKLVKANYLDLLKSSIMKKGDACWTGDQAACKAATDCNGCTCKVLKDPPLATGVEIGTAVALAIGLAPAAAIAAGTAGGAGAVATSVGNGVLSIVGKGADVVWSATKIIYKIGGGGLGGVAAVGGAGIGTAVLASELWEPDNAGAGERGVCLPFADHDIPKGLFCSDDGGCISNKCLMININLGVGICVVSDGTVDSICAQASDCTKVTGQVACVTTASEAYKKCTDGKMGSPCGTNSNCTTGLTCKGYVCAREGGGAEFAVCQSDGDCTQSQGLTCTRIIESIPGTCSAGNANSPCYQDTACKSGLICKAYCTTAACVQNFQSNGVQPIGTCAAKTTGTACFQDTHCNTGLVCCGESGDPATGELTEGVCQTSCP